MSQAITQAQLAGTACGMSDREVGGGPPVTGIHSRVFTFDNSTRKGLVTTGPSWLGVESRYGVLHPPVEVDDPTKRGVGLK